VGHYSLAGRFSDLLFDSDELQFFMENYVDGLLRFYEHGINVKTPNFLDGELYYLHGVIFADLI